ncbi:MAG: hypothetical protein K8L99_05500, partial [Anaerolineae bacterium]|nr:hypothetical protein [Anaerolineae bacterium]
MLTKSFETTTIIYYGFFLPGVILHELSVWLIAGILNIPAERAIRMPEKQEIAELDLSFIKLPRNISSFKLAIITAAPLIVGLLLVWVIANGILDVNAFFQTLETDGLDGLGTAISRLAAAPDFWLWIYLAFVISNTMVPDVKNLRGARILITIVVVALAILFVVGVGNEVVARVFAGPVADALYLLASIVTIVIALDILGIAFLGTIESLIERITGDSATFERGKLVAMTRQEMLEQKRRRSTRQLTSGRRSKAQALPAGPPSVYNLPFPIPGSPDQETVTQVGAQIIEPEEKPSLSSGIRDDRRGPDIITGTASQREIEDSITPPE